MGRVSGGGKKIERARQQLEKAIARGRLDDAIDAALSIPTPERKGLPVALTRMVAAAIDAAHGKQNRGAILSLWDRVGKEPAFLPPDPEAQARLRFIALTANLSAGRWPEVKRVWPSVEPWLAESGLAAAIRAYVEAEGEVLEATLAPFALESTRLGHEPKRRRRDYAPPTSMDDVEEACLTVYALEPHARFREVLEAFLAGAREPLASGIRATAIRLSHRDLVLASREPGSSGLEVARFVAGLAKNLDSACEHVATIELCLRAVARATATSAGPISDRKVAEAIATVFEASAGDATPMELIEALACRLRFAGAAREAGLAVYRAAVRIAKTAEVVLCVSDALAAHAREESGLYDPAPDFLVAAASELLERAPESIVEALRRREPQAAEELFTVWLVTLPVELALRALEVLPPLGDRAFCTLAAAAADRLTLSLREATEPSPASTIDRLREVLAMHDPFTATLPDAYFEQFARHPTGAALLREIEALTSSSGDLSDVIASSWATAFDPLLPYHPGLLDTRLELGVKPRERTNLARRFLAERPTLLARVEVLYECVQRALDHAERLLKSHLLDGLVPTRKDAASAFQFLDRLGAPLALRRTVAEALVLAPADPSGTDADVAWALREARRLLTKRPRKRKAEGSSPAKKKQRVKKAEQLDLLDRVEKP